MRFTRFFFLSIFRFPFTFGTGEFFIVIKYNHLAAVAFDFRRFVDFHFVGNDFFCGKFRSDKGKIGFGSDGRITEREA